MEFNVGLKDNILEDLGNVNSYDKLSPEHKNLKNKIINVGEFKN